MAARIDDSFIIIDKPCGHTSHEITTYVKRIAGVARSGHAGTLDPDVSGVLPVALGRATKLLRYIAGKDKTYVGIIKFRHVQGKEEIEELFSRFTGEIIQTPPKISAVRRRPRKRTIHHLKLLEIGTNPRLALFEARVDAGTYIRTLCEDIGKLCGGARMEELRRSAVGGITEKQSHTMAQLIDAMWFHKNRGEDSLLESMLLRPESLIDYPKVFIKHSALASILSGAQVMAPAVEGFQSPVSRTRRVALYCGDMFIGVGIMQLDSEELGKKGKGLAVRLERVHHPPGTPG